MIDEMAEVREYLGGKKPTAPTEYRCIYLLARYFVYYEKMDEVAATRRILDWGRSVGYKFEIRVSRIVYHVIHKPLPLRDGTTVRISNTELDEIERRFRKPKMRLLALGLISYGKVMADETGVVDVSVLGLCDWLGLSRSSVIRWMDVMERDGFLVKIMQKKRSKRIRTPVTRIKLLVPLDPAGEHEVRENDVHSLAREFLSLPQ